MSDNDKISSLTAQLADLPAGYISKKSIRGKTSYYRQWKENGKVKSEYINPDNLDYMISLISRRRSLQEELRLETLRASDSSDSQARLYEYANRFFLGRQVPIGVQDYETLISDRLFYIDKTLFIKEWWDKKDSVTLITRPRRFGKTLNMSMLKCFFSLQYANRSDLFQGQKIWLYPEYRQLQGTMPVISMSFGAVKLNSAEGIRDQLAFQLHQVLQDHYYLLEQKLLSADEELLFHQYLQSRDSLTALQIIPFLCQILTRIYSQKPILLLDEYDTPMVEAWSFGIWDECSNYMRNLLNALFKTNSYYSRAVLTGITRISSESFFSDLNNLHVVSPRSEEYATCFGFTEAEVFAAMDQQKLSEKDKVREWYNGFTFGGHTDIYNPWSITNYLRHHEFQAYWVHSSSNRLVSMLFQPAPPSVKSALCDLLQGRCIEANIKEDIAFDQLNSDPRILWSLLVSSGFLKLTSIDGADALTVTNKEVSIMLSEIVHDWFSNSNGYNEFTQALLEDDVDYMNEYMSRIIGSVFSYFDTSGKEPERFYHGFFLGLLVDLEDQFIIRSNRESGLGRYDVVLEPRDKQSRHGIILEFKIFRPGKEGSLEACADNALKQIKEKNYATELISNGCMEESIQCYGIAFHGKKCLIKKMA